MTKNWYRLDNAAMIFPPISDKNSPNTFCLQMTLDHKIDKDILSKSVNEVIKSEDTFRVRLKKGLFWYYLEENEKDPIVQEEPNDLMAFIDTRFDDNYLFRVFYFENRISVVFFHVLTDGTGGLYFLKQIVYRYLLNKGNKIDTEGLVKPVEMPTLNSDSDDTFMSVSRNVKEKKIAEQKAFKVSGTPFKRFGTGLIFAECATDEVKVLAKKYDTTITGYLCAVYLYSIYKAYIEGKNHKNKTVAISIPVNIRKKHPSTTKRNFSLVVRIAYDFSNETSFEEVVKSSAVQLKEKLTTEQLDAQIKTNVGAEKNVLMKIVPRVVKNLALKIAYKIRGVKQETSNFSNLGEVELPSSMAEKVKSVRFVLQASKTTEKNFSLIGYNKKLFFAFSRRHIETDAEKEFFKILSSNGVKVTVSSNNWEVAK